MFAHSDRDRDFDFLSSIEIGFVDRAEVMLMQNWEHVNTVFSMLNCMPAQNHDTDFSRVQEFFLNGQCVTLLFAFLYSAVVICIVCLLFVCVTVFAVRFSSFIRIINNVFFLLLAQSSTVKLFYCLRLRSLRSIRFSTVYAQVCLSFASFVLSDRFICVFFFLKR